jgi:anhydro-N-acetylmuramic acid kinase
LNHNEWVTPLLANKYFIGQMTGTSLDGLDTVLCQWLDAQLVMLAGRSDELPATLRSDLLALCHAGDNEIQLSQQAASALADCYATAVQSLLDAAGLSANKISAIGCHGQTVRHHPQDKIPFTLQLNNGARLAELTGIDCITDFRSRDIAAGGQGAPLVPAFHAQWLGHLPGTGILNIGGMANISIPQDGHCFGFDTGPGNVLMDGWCAHHTGQTYDKNGAWAAQGKIIPALLEAMLQDAYFALPPPKSTGREKFNGQWLQTFQPEQYAPQDVQTTLCELTALSISQSLQSFALQRLVICGGGAFNAYLLQRLQQHMADIEIHNSVNFGIAPQFVEACAFAWLAAQFTARNPVPVHYATGAKGPRILGALYPA